MVLVLNLCVWYIHHFINESSCVKRKKEYVILNGWARASVTVNFVYTRKQNSVPRYVPCLRYRL